VCVFILVISESMYHNISYSIFHSVFMCFSILKRFGSDSCRLLYSVIIFTCSSDKTNVQIVNMILGAFCHSCKLKKSARYMLLVLKKSSKFSTPRLSSAFKKNSPLWHLVFKCHVKTTARCAERRRGFQWRKWILGSKK
jgi:hypothetical protein